MTIECYLGDKVNVKITAKNIDLNNDFIGKYALVDKKDDKILTSGAIEFYDTFLVARVDTNLQIDTGKIYRTFEVLLQIENTKINLKKTYQIDIKIKTNPIRLL